jgi:hypothetical protein
MAFSAEFAEVMTNFATAGEADGDPMDEAVVYTSGVIYQMMGQMGLMRDSLKAVELRFEKRLEAAEEKFGAAGRAVAKEVGELKFETSRLSDSLRKVLGEETDTDSVPRTSKAKTGKNKRYKKNESSTSSTKMLTLANLSERFPILEESVRIQSEKKSVAVVADASVSLDTITYRLSKIEQLLLDEGIMPTFTRYIMKRNVVAQFALITRSNVRAILVLPRLQ